MSPTDYNDEITLKEIVLLLKAYSDEVKKRWKVILLMFIVFGSAMIYRAVSTKTTYIAELNFIVSEDEGGFGGGLTSILGDFGFGGGGEQNLEKILKMAQSRKIFGLVVFDSIHAKTKGDMLANTLFIELQEHHHLGLNPSYKFWKEDSKLKGFQFYQQDIQKFDRLERSAFLSMYGRLSHFLSSKIDEDTGIMELSITTHNESLSYDLCNQFFKQLSQFYINKTIEKQKETFDLINDKVDSIRALVKEKEYAVALYNERNRNIWRKKAKVPVSSLKKEVQMLYLMLGEAIKNKELAEFSLKNKTPFIQAIDEPIKPLMSIKPSWSSALIRAFIISMILGITYIVITKWIRAILK